MHTPSKGNALVVGKRTVKVDAVEQVLSRYFSEVFRITRLNDPIGSIAGDSFRLIVLADTFKPERTQHFLNGLRRAFPLAKIIGLVDRIDREKEIALRSAGLIFLGSYEYFIQNCAAILSPAFKFR